MAPDIFFWLIATVWLVLALVNFFAVRAIRSLPALKSSDAEPPRVSVVVAARNEAPRIEQTVRHLLAQRDVALELVVVDDRSTDGTTDILRSLEDQRLIIVRVDQLPIGWLGKCHALHLGAERATGDWLLFTDGDIWMRDDIVARAVAAARSEGVEHLCVLPGLGAPAQPGDSAIDRACLLTFLILFTVAMADANRDRPWRCLGVGAFNLVRADAYRALGGHQRLRLEIVDDMKLGLLLARAGFRTRGYFAPDEVACDWPTDAGGLLKALQKNAFAGAWLSAPVVVLLTVSLAIPWLAAMLGWLHGSIAAGAALAALLLHAVPAARLARLRNWSFPVAALTPLVGAPFLLLVLWNSMLVTLRQGGVRWRDTFYSLQELRRGLVK